MPIQTISFIALLFICPTALFAVSKPQEESELAKLLAEEKTRAKAIERIIRRPTDFEPLLLRWTEALPPGVKKEALYFGLIEAFGQLRTKKAVPFLIENINWRYPVFSWDKTPQVIIENSPAIRALLHIGKDATGPLIKAYLAPLTPEDRLAVVFTLAQLRDARAASILRDARRHALAEIYRAEEGLALLDEKVNRSKTQGSSPEK